MVLSPLLQELGLVAAAVNGVHGDVVTAAMLAGAHEQVRADYLALREQYPAMPEPSGLTLPDLSPRLRAQEFGLETQTMGPDMFRELLDRLAGLSEEELDALLERSAGGGAGALDDDEDENELFAALDEQDGLDPDEVPFEEDDPGFAEGLDGVNSPDGGAPSAPQAQGVQDGEGELDAVQLLRALHGVGDVARGRGVRRALRSAAGRAPARRRGPGAGGLAGAPGAVAGAAGSPAAGP
ncbi:MAG: hypothetical protein M3P93_02740 [Actinomycetota bacterium]|jgi:hypothetical protein|nr:hypothetical protein [Actinomycetota bacterium]